MGQMLPNGIRLLDKDTDWVFDGQDEIYWYDYMYEIADTAWGHRLVFICHGDEFDSDMAPIEIQVPCKWSGPMPHSFLDVDTCLWETLEEYLANPESDANGRKFEL